MITIGMQVLRGDGDFIGVVDENGRTLQIMINDLNDIRIEVPEPSKRGSWARTFSVKNIENELLSIALPFDANTTKEWYSSRGEEYSFSYRSSYSNLISIK